MKTTLPTPTQRADQLRRQERERDAFKLIEELAALRDTWRPEDVPQGTVEALLEAWDSISVTEDDIAALRIWPQLPLTLPGLLFNISQNISEAWGWRLG